MWFIIFGRPLRLGSASSAEPRKRYARVMSVVARKATGGRGKESACYVHMYDIVGLLVVRVVAGPESLIGKFLLSTFVRILGLGRERSGSCRCDL